MNSNLISIQTALILVLGIWVGFLSYLIFKTIANYNRLTQGITKLTLSEILKELLDHETTTQAEMKKILDQIDELEKKNLVNIQKMGLVRYNPFADTGGDQSFSLALLDGRDNGVVITSLYARTSVRWYIKTIKKGKGLEHELSEEEKSALKKARV